MLKSMVSVSANSKYYLTVIILVGLSLRLFALNWGLPSNSPFHTASFHPDEAAGVSSIQHLIDKPLSATRYMYTKGSGYFYLSAIVSSVADSLGFISIDETGKEADLISLQRLYLIARLVNVVFSTAAILLTYLIGKNLLSNSGGLLAALIVAVSPISVIDAHYVKTDTSEAFFILVSLYFAVLARNNLKLVLCSMFFAGVAGAFKYPGISAVAFGIISAVLFARNFASSLKYVMMGLPLVVCGFLLTFPSIVIDPEQFFGGIQSEFFKKLSSQENSQYIMNVALYPWFLAKASGVLFILLVFISTIFNIIKLDKKTVVMLPWFIIYFFLMSGSSVALIRYAVPGIPIAALLIAMMVFKTLETQGKHRKIIVTFVAATILHLASVAGIHVYKMSALDPRELAGFWIQNNIPTSSEVAITPSHYGDRYFTVPVDPRLHRRVKLMMRHNHDASNYLRGASFDIVAANESAWRPRRAKKKLKSHILFWRQLQEEWSLMAVFNNRPCWIGLPMAGELPEDLYYIYQEVRIYEKNSSKQFKR